MKTITVALIGGPNAGKSTLFNRILGKRKIIESSIFGSTIDRHYDETVIDDVLIRFIDSGGYNPDRVGVVAKQAQDQTEKAMKEADMFLYLFDAKAGITNYDNKLIKLVRIQGKPTIFAVNKIDNPDQELLCSEFYSLGIGDLHPISAIHKKNIDILLHMICASALALSKPVTPHKNLAMQLTFVGRPNTGKSTLINTLCSEQKVIVTDEPGTTRDINYICLSHTDEEIMLIDTPGLRRKSKTRTPHQGLLQLIAQKAIQSSDVVGLLIDAVEGLTAGDVRIAQLIRTTGKACCILLNKWDAVKDPILTQKKIMDKLSLHLSFMHWAPVLTISALTTLRTNRIIPLVKEIYHNYSQQFDKNKLKHAISEMLIHHRLLWKRKIIEIKKVSYISNKPPLVQLEMYHPEMLHFSHIRYIENELRKQFTLTGTPVIIKAVSRT